MSRSSEGQGHNAAFVKRFWPKQQCVWVWSKSVD